jgi:hypothetical protein
MFRSHKDHRQVCMLHVNWYTAGELFMPLHIKLFLHYLHETNYFLFCSKFKNRKLKSSNVVCCGAPVNVTYLFVDGVCLYTSRYVWLRLTCVRACVRGESTLKIISEFWKFKYTNYSRVLITPNHLEAKFNVPLSCQPYVLISFVTRFLGC